MTFERFCLRIRSYCDATAGSVTSWGRTVKHNRDVGGDARSLHVAWKAVDVVYDPPAPALDVRQTLAASFGLYVWPEDDHDHLRPIDEVWV